MKIGQKDALGRTWTVKRARAMKANRAKRNGHALPPPASTGPSLDAALRGMIADEVRRALGNATATVKLSVEI